MFKGYYGAAPRAGFQPGPQAGAGVGAGIREAVAARRTAQPVRPQMDADTRKRMLTSMALKNISNQFGNPRGAY